MTVTVAGLPVAMRLGDTVSATEVVGDVET
jgi:hypothetical protein